MSEPKPLDPLVRLRLALEERNPEGDPDDFVELIRATLEAPGDPYMALCRAAFGHYRQGEMSFFERWASGLSAPAPLMRRKVANALRAYLASGLIGRG